MAKKVLALLLTLAMLTAGMTFGTSAAAATEKVDGVLYTPVTTEKEFLDASRVRNGNLTVLLTVRMKNSDEL